MFDIVLKCDIMYMIRGNKVERMKYQIILNS